MEQVNQLGEPRWLSVCRWLAPLRWIYRGYSAVEGGIFFASMCIIVGFMLLVTVEVVGRYVFNKPIYGQLEVVEILLPGLVFAGMAYVQRKQSHVRLDLFLCRLKGKAYHGTECLIMAIAFIPMAMVAIYATKHALSLRELGSSTALLGLPHWPFAICVGIGCAFASIRLIISLIQHFVAFLGKEGRE